MGFLRRLLGLEQKTEGTWITTKEFKRKRLAEEAPHAHRMEWVVIEKQVHSHTGEEREKEMFSVNAGWELKD